MSLTIGKEMDILVDLDIMDRRSVPPTPPPTTPISLGYRFLRHFADSAMHTFVLSVFESVFFWTYISKEEDAAFLRNLMHLRAMVSVMCTDNDINDIDTIIDADMLETKSQVQHDNNLALVYTTCYLSTTLLALTLLATFMCSKGALVEEDRYVVTGRFKWVRETMRSLKASILPLSMIGMYEVIFFQTVVRLYMPISPETIYMELFGACIQV